MVDDTVIVDTNPMGQMMGLGAVTLSSFQFPKRNTHAEGLGLTVFHATRTVRVSEDAPRSRGGGALARWRVGLGRV